MAATLSESLASSLPDTKYSIPEPRSPVTSVISRWSDTNVSLPAVVVVPTTEDEIIAALRIATAHRLRVVPAAGGHAPFLPIGDHVMYLDLKKFDSVEAGDGIVTLGGGATTGPVLRACAEKGYYYLAPNSNAVGVVGALLGGGNSMFTGHHGMLSDHVLSIRVITAAGSILTLTPDSQGDEAALFRAFCGAGHGLGVVTSLTLRTWPVAGLGAVDNKIWTRQAIFPPPAIDVAAEAFMSLVARANPSTLPIILFARAPPGAPKPGAPLIIMSMSYFGPPAEAETAAAGLLEPSVVEKAIMANTQSIPVAAVNDATEPANAHGGFKEMASTSTAQVSAAIIKKLFQRWLQLGDESADLGARTNLFVAHKDQAASVAGGAAGGGGRFYEPRDRSILMQATTVYALPETKPLADKFADDVARISRELDAENGHRPLVSVNSSRYGTDMGYIYGPENLAEARKVKAAWDKDSLFWSIVTDPAYSS